MVLLAALLTAISASLVAPAPAWAHNSLVEASPAKNATLAAAPAEIRLRFLATLKKSATELKITGPDGAVAGGPPTVSGKIVRAPFTGTAAGGYQVEYKVESEDGHEVKGRYTFTVTTGAASSPSASATAAPSAEPSPAASVTSMVAVGPLAGESGETSGGTLPYLVGLGGLLVVGGAFMVMRRRKLREDG